MSTFFKSILVLLLCVQICNGQNETLEHVIKKGENVYRISLRYKVSMDEIYNLNPEAKTVIRTGEILLIPKKNILNKKEFSGNYKSYLVAKGETKYGISKAFNISISELEEANPFIKQGLQAGHNLRIPLTDASQNPNNTITEHIVVKGETLWGISQKYGLTLDEIINLNKERLGNILQIGQVLKVSESSGNTNKLATTYKVIKGDTKYGLSKRFGISIAELERLNPQIVDMLRTDAIITIKSPDENLVKQTPNNTVAVKEEEVLNDNDKNEEVVSNQPYKTDIYWIEPSTENNALDNANDYLKGIKHAIASAKTKQPEMILDLIALNKSDSLKFDHNDNNSSRFKIKPIPNFNNINDSSKLGTFILSEVDGDTNQTVIVKALPTSAVMQNKTIEYLKEVNGNVICLFDRNHSVNTKSIRNSIPDVELIKLNRNGSFRAKELTGNLDGNRKNYVIIESSRVGVFLSATSLLLKESSNFDIQLVVLNPQNIPDSSQISYNRFKVLNLTYPLPYNPNYLKETSKSYKLAYLISSDILNRLNLNGLNAFKTVESSSFLGTVFSYKFNDNMAQNTAVSLFMFNDDSDAYLLGTY